MASEYVNYILWAPPTNWEYLLAIDTFRSNSLPWSVNTSADAPNHATTLSKKAATANSA